MCVSLFVCSIIAPRFPFIRGKNLFSLSFLVLRLGERTTQTIIGGPYTYKKIKLITCSVGLPIWPERGNEKSNREKKEANFGHKLRGFLHRFSWRCEVYRIVQKWQWVGFYDNDNPKPVSGQHFLAKFEWRSEPFFCSKRKTLFLSLQKNGWESHSNFAKKCCLLTYLRFS